MQKRYLSTALNFIHQPTWKSHPHILKSQEIVPGITKSHFDARLEKLKAILPENSTAIIPSYKTKYGSQNIFYPFQQNNNLLYLTGFNEPDSCLVLEKASNSSDICVKFFATPNDKESMLWTGPRAGIEGCKEIFGLQNVYEINKLDDFVSELKTRSGSFSVFVDYHSDNSSLNPESFKSLNDKIRLKPLESIFCKLRLVKSEEEQNLMKISGSIAAESLKETMKYSRGAKSEAELASFMEFKCRSKGAERLAYIPVVAGASRGLVLHYTHNNQLLDVAKDWVLMDAGCLYFGYCSDITRSWPLSGRFSKAQVDLYSAVLNVQLGCLKALQSVPKLSFAQLNDVAAYLTAVELDRLGFRNVESNIHRWFPHSIGHHLGLDLHDCPKHNPHDALCAGNVITVEPGIYIPFEDTDAPKEYRGLAIRIEDDIAIGPHGTFVNLTEGVPKTIDEIEALIN